MTDDTWPEWTDVLGQKYGPGDLVSIATISGKSPQLVIARVVEIRKRDSKGELIEEGEYEYLTNYDGSPKMDPNHPTRQLTEWHSTPSCKVKAMPLKDARGFGRWNKRWNAVTATYEDAGARAVTYGHWRNILKINKDLLP